MKRSLLLSYQALALLIAGMLSLSHAVYAQTNSFPLYSSGAWSGGSGDETNVTSPQLKLQSTSSFIRVSHVSSASTISAVYNFETGKDAYWGEVNDIGNYWFRGRNVLLQGGSLGIGTTNTQGYQLAVNGSAIFTSARVKAYANWPDYVFNCDYRLPPLDSIASYIQTNHHLPDLPDADSVQANGIDVGITAAALLKKIEELTLYVIEQKKLLEAQGMEIKRLKKNIERKIRN